MTTSSAQPTCSITSSSLDNSYTGFIAQDIGTLLPDTITLTGSNVYDSVTTANTITVDLGGVGAGASCVLSGTGLSDVAFTWKSPEEWVDCFPDFDKIMDMNEKYPALKIAFEKFKQMYVLVEDDYTSKKGKKYAP